MVSAPPLCNSVHGWVSADHIRLCSIKEDRTSYTEDSPRVKLQSALCEECCVDSDYMQVDSTQMNVGDGDALSTEGAAPNRVPESMVGNPLPQMLPPELATDVPLNPQSKPAPEAGPKPSHISSKGSQLKHCLEAPPSLRCANSSTVCPAPVSAALCEKTEISPKNVEGSGSPGSGSPGSGNPVKRAAAQIQSVISLAPGFQCSTHFKAGQPVAFFSGANLSSPLCKITLPPALGQIAALREATANQFSKVCQLQNSGSCVTPQLRPYPYHFPIGRVVSAESKPSSVAPKHACGPASCSKSSKAGRERDKPLDSGASPAVSVPLKQPMSGSPPAPLLPVPPSPRVEGGPTLASFPAPSRPPNHVEKCLSHHSTEKSSLAHAKLKFPGAAEECVVLCPAEARDMPLDLSSKSKRQKSAGALPKTSQAELCGPEAEKNDPTSAKGTPRSQTSSLGPSTPYTVFSETLRNGTLPKNSTSFLNHQASEPSAPWAARSSPQGSVNPPGTYVGVASPVLASSLCSRDGNGAAFVEDMQSAAKQETISIIDQGEQLASRGKKGLSVAKDLQRCSPSKHASGIHPEGRLKDVFPTALSGFGKPRAHCKTGSGKAVLPRSPNGNKPAWHQLCLPPHQGASAVQRRNSQGTPKLEVASDGEGIPFHSPLTSPPQVPEGKWDRTKSPLSNLESIVKQQALETTALVASEGWRNPATVESRGSEAAERQDTPARQIEAGGLPPPKCAKKKPGRPEKDLLWVAREQERRSAVEPREKTLEKGITQGEDPGVKDRSNGSALSVKPWASGDGGTRDRNDMGAKTIHGFDGERAEGKTESLSPCVKLEGIALSILKGQSTGVPEPKRKASGTKDARDSPSKGRALVTKCKKLTSVKNDRLLTEPLRKTTACVKLQEKESPGTKQAKKQWKRSVPLQELGEPELEEGKRKRGGRCSVATVEQLSRNQADGVVVDMAALRGVGAPGSRQGSPGRPRKEGGTPGPRRGRRPAEEAVPQDDRSPPRQLPPPPPPPPPLRRPRGRPRSNPLPDQARQGAAGEGELSTGRRRRRRGNRRYQNGEYVVGCVQAEEETEEKCVTTRQSARAGADLRMTGVHPRQSAPLPRQGTGPDGSPRGALLTRSGSMRRPEPRSTPDPGDKPSGKRKFKSKHLSGAEEGKKLKVKRGPLGKRSAAPVVEADSSPAKRLHPPVPVATPKGLSSPLTSRRGSGGRGGVLESPPCRPIPPEVRRLIVNKNAGETLLQRAARLGYQEVVLYCLEKDMREVNRRDNAGYTALHEACSRGWAHIVRVLLEHGADVNCSAQDGTRPIHDAVVNDNLTVVWMLLNHGADPTLATYSGQTALKLAHSNNMKTFLMEYFSDLEGRKEQDPNLHWDFYSSVVFETEERACWDFLLSLPEEDEEKCEGRGKEREERTAGDCFLFEFSAEPLLPCYHIQVSLTQGFCNWFLLSDVLRRLKMSARIFRARYPHLEVVGIAGAELRRQASVSQVTPLPRELPMADEEGEGPVELVRCVPDLHGLLGSTMHILEEELSLDTVRPHSR